jgi:hypothetical protein
MVPLSVGNFLAIMILVGLCLHLFLGHWPFQKRYHSIRTKYIDLVSFIGVPSKLSPVRSLLQYNPEMPDRGSGFF